jgi:hypothetical protein
VHRPAATLKLRAGPADHLYVRTTHRLLLPFVALSAVALCLAALTPARAAADHDDGHHFPDPRPVTGAATAVAATTATLNGVVRRGTTYYFEYGPTTAYGTRTPPQSVPNGDGTVSVLVEGLTPATLYHFRVVAVFGGRLEFRGADATFTTAAAVAAPAPAPIPAAPVAAPQAPAGPTLGRSVGLAPVKGTVTVKVPGAATFSALGGGATVPVGAVLDTRRGTVQLTTAVEGGATQTATFHSGVFEVRQPANGRGLTDIVLRGPALTCPRVRRGGKATARAAAAQTKTKKRKRQLWARDKGGRFRTHGRNSVATVRGTRWVTTDTCAGTRTTVTEGSVSVRDLRRKRTVVVRKGKTYLARGRR